MATTIQKLGAYARLLRLSNAPTAVADVWMGYAVSTGELIPSWPLTWLTLGSLMLYLGGMVHNDVRDIRRDRNQQRERPIVQGLVSHRVADGLARLLLVLGMTIAIGGVVAGHTTDHHRIPFQGQNLPILLLIAIVAYNGRLKRTVFGPLLMATCRALNGALGMAMGSMSPGVVTVLPGIFAYVLGLTVFARDEALGGKRGQLVLGCLASVAGILWLLIAPLIAEDVGLNAKPIAWVASIVVAGLFSVRGMFAAILQPTPKNIGRGVGIAIQGLIVIDATLAAVYAGPMAGLAIFSLLPVTMLLSKWIPQT